MSDSETPTSSGYGSPSTPPRRWEFGSRSPSAGPSNSRGSSAAPEPSRARSPPILDDPPGPRTAEPPDACLSCHKNINLPSAIYSMSHCPDCTGRTFDCAVCRGSGLSATPLRDGTRADCNACVGTGRMALCTICSGSARIRCGDCGGRRGGCRFCEWSGAIPCFQCGNHGGLRRCPRCESAGWVATFHKFCVGDAMHWPPGRGRTARRHPNTGGFARALWGRVEVPRGHPDEGRWIGPAGR